VIESAFRLASEWNHRYVGTGHLLMGLVSEADGAAAAVFKEKDVTPDSITAEINRLRDTVGPED
jgi:ATP-dependent Clp protease ATP-binding subunit ClpA